MTLVILRNSKKLIPEEKGLMWRKWILLWVLGLLLIASSCAQSEDVQSDKAISASLRYDHSMKLDYADGFSVDYYQDGYVLLSVKRDGRFFIVPEGADVPEDLPKDITVLKQPVTNIYLAASAVMDMFCAMDGLDRIRLSGTKQDSWYVDGAREAMESGAVLYAGKYNEPDYEQILSENCGLSIQSTMILKAPEIKEKLETLGIPVLVDYSSYEKHPLGRTEWIRLYGVLAQREAEAERAFLEQKEAFLEVLQKEQMVETEKKTVAFFYITSKGAVSVRKTGDYIPKIIELAGGSYLFKNLEDTDNVAPSVSMQMEKFYEKAKDADYIIYNSTMDGGIRSIAELLEKNSMFENFKAVQSGNVFCTTEDLYQASMETGGMISDIHTMLTVEDASDEEFEFLFRLE